MTENKRLNDIISLCVFVVIVCVGIIILSGGDSYTECNCVEKFGDGEYTIIQETSVGIIPFGAKYTIYCINESNEWLILETNL